MRCRYCFYRRVEDLYPGSMPIMDTDTAKTIIRKTLGLGYGRNHFSWQGGEPTLMGIDFFREVLRYQRQFAQPGQIIGNSLQTNGVLIDAAWAEFLAEGRFFVGLSLDGPPALHDAYRRLAPGGGSHAKVMNAASLLRAHGVEFNILTVIHDQNVAYPEILYWFFRSNGFSHLQFIPCLEWSPATGEPSSFSISADELGRFQTRLFDLWLKDGFMDVSIRTFEDILLYYLDGVHVTCNWFKECSSYLVVEHNGDVYPCDFFVYPEWKLGNLLEDTYRSIAGSPLWMKFRTMKSNLVEVCQNCRWLSFCNGDCTRIRTEGGGPFGGLSRLCVARKMLLDHMEPHLESIRKRVLRIRRQGDHTKARLATKGRNDPCPCGSGEKYKRCCGRQ